MNRENKIYAAYGSNMNLEQMAYRCPYATVIGNAELKDYQLLFRGINGSAVATVEPKQGQGVPIVLWEITHCDEDELDIYEGWPWLYRKETIVVAYKGKELQAMAYIMNDGKLLGLPSAGYLATITDGYKSAGLNKDVLTEAVEYSKNNIGKGRHIENSVLMVTDTIVEQILEIRASGKYNMFSADDVQREASELDFHELVIFIEEHRDIYTRFILNGKRN